MGSAADILPEISRCGKTCPVFDIALRYEKLCFL
jgi:hypothetical protein